MAILEGPWAAWNGLADGLRGEGLEVEWVSRDASQFLDVLGTNAPQVAVLDVESDGAATVGCSVTDGLNLLRGARKRQLEVRFLVISSVNSPGVMSQYFDEGAYGYLFRSGLGTSSVATAIHSVVRGERLFPVQRQVRRPHRPRC
ncbi:hypothetical protein ACLEPN_22215 [Myxococcus sp. 1LA]